MEEGNNQGKSAKSSQDCEARLFIFVVAAGVGDNEAVGFCCVVFVCGSSGGVCPFRAFASTKVEPRVTLRKTSQPRDC